MKPIQETRDALERLALHGDDDLGAQMTTVNDRLSALVPGLVAFSVGVARHGIVLTYVSTGLEASRLDAMQYVDDGPCQLAARTGDIVAVSHEDLLDEGRWQLFAQAGAAFGILSTLSLPVIDLDNVVGGVNLYGSATNTFVGRHEELADIVGGWAAGAVTNADLSFDTRREATRAPRRLDDLETVSTAVGVLVASKGVSPGFAESKLYEAAARAGIPVVALAHMVIGESGAGGEGDFDPAEDL